MAFFLFLFGFCNNQSFPIILYSNKINPNDTDLAMQVDSCAFSGRSLRHVLMGKKNAEKLELRESPVDLVTRTPMTWKAKPGRRRSLILPFDDDDHTTM
jgi:hypothetical protein